MLRDELCYGVRVIVERRAGSSFVRELTRCKLS